MTQEREVIADTKEPIEKLRRIEEFTIEPVSPFVAEFARFLANRIHADELVPIGFIMAANLSVYDLQKGVNGFTGEPINNNLVGRTPELYAMLTANIPGLAKLAFDEDFANAADALFEEMLQDMATHREAAFELPETPADSDVIQTPIDNITQAKEHIINDAKRRVLALNWVQFGITDLEEVEKICDPSSLLALRNAGMNFLLNLLDITNPREKHIFDSLPAGHKSQIKDNYWLVMLRGSIEPEEATFIRDWLWMKLPEAVAGLKDLPQERIIETLMLQTPALEKAAFRARRYMSRREA